MVIRRVAGTGAAPRRRPFSLFAPLLLVAVAAAQEPAPSGGAPSSGAPSAVAPSTTAPSQVAPVYGRVVADSAPLRCWSSAVAAPPVFEDVLVKGEVVQLGRVENGFRAVLLPLGPLGYVTKRFTSVAEDGTVTTSEAKVAVAALQKRIDRKSVV